MDPANYKASLRTFTTEQESALKIALLFIPGIIPNICGISEERTLSLMNSKMMSDKEALQIRSGANWILESYKRFFGANTPLMMSNEPVYVEWISHVMSACHDSAEFFREFEFPDRQARQLEQCKQNLGEALKNFSSSFPGIKICLEDSVYPVIFQIAGANRRAQIALFGQITSEIMLGQAVTGAPPPSEDNPLTITGTMISELVESGLRNLNSNN